MLICLLADGNCYNAINGPLIALSSNYFIIMTDSNLFVQFAHQELSNQWSVMNCAVRVPRTASLRIEEQPNVDVTLDTTGPPKIPNGCTAHVILFHFLSTRPRMTHLGFSFEQSHHQHHKTLPSASLTNQQ